jgi:hypothetical protein
MPCLTYSMGVAECLGQWRGGRRKGRGAYSVFKSECFLVSEGGLEFLLGGGSGYSHGRCPWPLRGAMGMPSPIRLVNPLRCDKLTHPLPGKEKPALKWRAK